MTIETRLKLPEGWSNCVVDDVAEIIRGIAFPNDAKCLVSDNGLIACLRTKNIQSKVEWDDLLWIPEKYVRKAEQILRSGDILISVANSYELVGKVALVNEPKVRATLGAFIAIIRSFKYIDSRFLYYLLASSQIQYAIRRVASTTTNISNVNTTKVRAIEIRVAPVREQKRIADKLDEILSDLEEGASALERVRAKLKLYRASVLKAAVEGSLTAKWRSRHPATEPASVLLERILAERRRRWEEDQLTKYREAGKTPPKDWRARYREPIAPDTSNLPALPERWCWAYTQQVGHIQLGRQRAPQHHRGDFMRPYLRVANVYEDHIDLSSIYEMNFNPEEFKTYQLQYGDILLNEGQSLELVGRSAIYRNELQGACFTNTLIRFRTYDGLLPEFAQIYFKACVRNHRFRKLARWTTNIAHLGADRFAEMEIPLPPLPEQVAIVEAVEDQLSVIDHLEADLNVKLKSAQLLRQSILHWAFTGRLVPQDPNDEPASELLKRIATEREDRDRQARAARQVNPKPRGRRPRAART